jgi:hypothetical protein
VILPVLSAQELQQEIVLLSEKLQWIVNQGRLQWRSAPDDGGDISTETRWAIQINPGKCCQ